MKYKNMNKIKSLFLFAIIICGLSCALFANVHTADAAKKAKLTVAKKPSTKDRKVKFKVTGKGIIGIDVSEFYYYDSDDEDHEITKSVKFKRKSDDRWEASYPCKEKAYGDYIITLTVMYEDGSIDEIDGSFVYKTNEKKSGGSVEIAAPEKPVFIENVKTFDGSFYIINKSGKELFVKKGETIIVDVLYRATDKDIVTEKNVKLKWGQKVISPSPGKFNKQSKKDGDYYNIGAEFTITTDSDMDGELVAWYEGDQKKGIKKKSQSLGIKLDSDGTAPAIKIDKEYTGSNTKYYNKPVSVPITITEKNFDDSKAKVTVNGTKVKASWKSKGAEHKTDINLSEGQNVIEISAVDKAGNDSKKAKSATIIIDTKRPSVNIEGFENGTGKGLENGEVVPYPVQVTISDETSLADASAELCKIEEDGVTRTPVELRRNQNGNTVTYSIDDLKDDGLYEIVVTAKDSAGNNPSSDTVSSEGTNPYNVDGGKISGSFTVNREGSLYKAENEEYFGKPYKEIPDLVIYEYNKNEITDTNIMIIDSIEAKEIRRDEQYTFEPVESDLDKYTYKYKYTISGSNFMEDGYYSIQINSKSIAGDNGSLITRIEESNSINKTIIIDTTSPEIILFEGSTDGAVTVKVRDNNMDVSSVRLTVDGEECQLTVDADESTTTNIVYTGNIGKNPENSVIELTCQDLAGNPAESKEMVIYKVSMLKTYLMFGGLGAALVVLIVITVIILVSVKKQKAKVI